MGITLQDQIEWVAETYTTVRLDQALKDLAVDRSSIVDTDAEYVLKQALHLRRVSERIHNKMVEVS